MSWYSSPEREVNWRWTTNWRSLLTSELVCDSMSRCMAVLFPVPELATGGLSLAAMPKGVLRALMEIASPGHGEEPSLWLPLSVSHSGNTLFLAVGILEIPITSAVVFPLLPHHGYSEFGCRLRQSSPSVIQVLRIGACQGLLLCIEAKLVHAFSQMREMSGVSCCLNKITHRLTHMQTILLRDNALLNSLPLFHLSSLCLHGHSSCVTGCFLFGVVCGVLVCCLVCLLFGGFFLAVGMQPHKSEPAHIAPRLVQKKKLSESQAPTSR